jgi:hypothetical protein
MLPVPITQRPLQHWSLVTHVSLIWRQNEPVGSHLPFTHAFEQHWLSAVHALPEPLHTPPLIDWQRPPVHLPLQHWPLLVQATPSPVHAVALQRASAPQNPEQQSLPALHAVAEPVAMHGPSRLPHWFAA